MNGIRYKSLMPGTAQDWARKLGVGYDGAKLTGDPGYNVMIGSAYFRHLLGVWNGSADLHGAWQLDRAFQPVMNADLAAHRRGRWREALNRSRDWEERTKGS